MTSKSWCFTLNNYSENDITLLKDIDCSYLIFGKEVGESGTPHLQGFITFKTTKRLTGLKKLHKGIHWEISRNVEASINYCMKDKDYFIKDNRKQGERNDLKRMIDCMEKNGLQTAIENYKETYVKYSNGIEKLAGRLQKPRTEKPHIVWIYGSTGTGKTRQVYEKEKDLWISAKNLKWWNGYENQEAVLIDDFRSDFCTFHELLRILDRYPYKVEIKGGHRELNSKRIYITSCYHPDNVYKTIEDKTQLLRRIDEIICTDVDKVTYADGESPDDLVS